MSLQTDLPRIAYLTAQYPTVSHTFILREVQALRALGLDVQTCSVRKTPASQHPGPDEKHEASQTFNILQHAKSVPQLVSSLIWALRQGGRLFKTLGLALHMRSPGVSALVYQLIYLVEACILARHLRSNQIAHLHIHFANSASTVGMLAAHLADIPFSFTLHGPSDLMDPERWRLDIKIAHAKFVACISNYARSQGMLNSAPQHWHKLNIVHCGVIPENYKTQGQAAQAGLSLMFVGRVAPVKGLRVLLNVMGDVPKDVRVTIVGDGPDMAWLKEAAAPFGDRVHLTGYLSQDEVAAQIAAHDALILPSFAEGVPVVLMEAMAGGKPVIATQVAGVSELVQTGQSGFVVPPGDEHALTQAIKDLATMTQEQRDQMGQAGRAKVQADFDIRDQAKLLADLFGDTGV